MSRTELKLQKDKATAKRMTKRSENASNSVVRFSSMQESKTSNYELYEATVKEMLRDGESDLYIKIYINDLLRGKDITPDEAQQLHFIMVDAIGGNGFTTITERR